MGPINGREVGYGMEEAKKRMRGEGTVEKYKSNKCVRFLFVFGIIV